MSDLLNGDLANILNFLAAAGALGTASFGLVDAFKAFGGGVSNAGFRYVRKAVERLIGHTGISVFGKADVAQTLRANWLNGMAKSDQKAIAKSLIRLELTPDNASALAKAVGIDAEALRQCAENIAAGKQLTAENFNILGRLDTILNAILDEAYERADQQYRNTSKLVAGLVAIVLAAVAGGLIFTNAQGPSSSVGNYLISRDFLIAILVGVVATPLAPIVKDLSSSLNAAMKAVGGMRRQVP